MDLRERIVAAVDAGMTQSQAAERLEVSLRTVERYLARRRVTGSLAATEQRHGPEPKVRRALKAWLPDRLGAAGGAPPGGHGGAVRAGRGGAGAPGSVVRGVPRLAAAADATLAEHVAAFVADGGARVSLASMSRAITGLPPEPGDELTPSGRKRRAGRPLKQKLDRHRARRVRAGPVAGSDERC